MAKRKSKSAQPAVHISENISSKWLIAILCLHVVLALIYWHYTPFGASPDEGPHAKYVQQMVDTHAFPVYQTSSNDGYEFYQPPFYYMLGVPFYAIGRVLSPANPLIMLRLLSLILGGLSVFVIYLAVLRVFPDRKKLALSCAAFVAFLPTHVMMSSSVSNDILMELAFGLFFLIAAGIVMDGPSSRRAVALGLVLGLGLLAKMTCLLLFPMAAVLYLVIWKRTAAKTAAAHLALAVGVGLVVGGWWFIRNQMVYHDLLGMTQLQQAFSSHSPKPEDFFKQGMPVWLYLAQVLMWTFRSFWGVFGHMDIFMPGWIYWILALLSVVALVGSYRQIVQLKESSKLTAANLATYGVGLGLVLLVFLNLNTTVFQAQGRYLYPALIPISVIWVLGLCGMIPERNRGVLPYLLAVGIPLIVQIVAITTCIIPELPYL